MPKPRKTEELLSRLLTGEVPTSDDVKQIVMYGEDQFLDYKAGALLKDNPKDAGTEIRKDLTAFLNAMGGVILVGYYEDEKDSTKSKLDGAAAPGGGPLATWAARVLLQTLRPFPTPRFATVDVDGKDILLVAVRRSRFLIPVVEGSEPVYWIRIGSETTRAPSFLVADLLLGDRARPELSAHIQSADIQGIADDGQGFHVDQVRLWLTVENVGFSYADDLRFGLVSWMPSKPASVPVPNSLLQQLECPEPAPMSGWPWKWSLGLMRGPNNSLPILEAGLGPSESVQHLSFTAPWNIHRGPRYEIRAALYVVARTAEPLWYQVVLQCPWDGSMRPELFLLEPVLDAPPEVSVTPI